MYPSMLNTWPNEKHLMLASLAMCLWRIWPRVKRIEGGREGACGNSSRRVTNLLSTCCWPMYLLAPRSSLCFAHKANHSIFGNLIACTSFEAGFATAGQIVCSVIWSSCFVQAFLACRMATKVLAPRTVRWCNQTKTSECLAVSPEYSDGFRYKVSSVCCSEVGYAGQGQACWAFTMELGQNDCRFYVTEAFVLSSIFRNSRWIHSLHGHEFGCLVWTRIRLDAAWG